MTKLEESLKKYWEEKKVEIKKNPTEYILPFMVMLLFFWTFPEILFKELFFILMLIMLCVYFLLNSHRAFVGALVITSLMKLSLIFPMNSLGSHIPEKYRFLFPAMVDDLILVFIVLFFFFFVLEFLIRLFRSPRVLIKRNNNDEKIKPGF